MKTSTLTSLQTILRLRRYTFSLPKLTPKGWQPFPNAWSTSPIGTEPRELSLHAQNSVSLQHSSKEPSHGVKKTRKEKQTTIYRSSSVDEMRKAEQAILKSVQEEAFSEEIKTLKSLGVSNDDTSRESMRRRNSSMKKTSSLYRLDPFIDEDGVLRVGGRIRNASISYDVKHPVILPSKGHVTMLLVRHHHERISHQGRGITLNDLRSHGYWIIGGNSSVSRYISKCVTCRKLRGALEEQKMANLPEDRLEPAPPFTHCGVDYFGPFVIKEGRKELKRYGVLFT